MHVADRGLLDGKIKSFDTNAGSNEDMGTHHDAVRCLAFSDAHSTYFVNFRD